jgi:cation:H+ antiporter
MSYLLILAGFVLLVLGGDFLVRASVSLALRMKVSTMVIGLTVVSFSTSAPELLVSVEAAFRNHPEIAIGNVIGSNIANIGLILGATALFFKIQIPEVTFRKDWTFMMLTTILLLGLMFLGTIHFWGGLLLFSLLVIYHVLKIRDSRKQFVAVESLPSAQLEDVSNQQMPIGKMILLLLGGIIALRYGAKFLIDGAIPLATNFGISERVISLTLISVGTSIPELAASFVAAFKKENDISLGNIIGSNIFNILGVLGITAMVKAVPITDSSSLYFDGMWMLALTAILFPLSIFFTRGEISRGEGGLILFAYLTYVYLLF